MCHTMRWAQRLHRSRAGAVACVRRRGDEQSLVRPIRIKTPTSRGRPRASQGGDASRSESTGVRRAPPARA